MMRTGVRPAVLETWSIHRPRERRKESKPDRFELSSSKYAGASSKPHCPEYNNKRYASVLNLDIFSEPCLIGCVASRRVDRLETPLPQWPRMSIPAPAKTREVEHLVGNESLTSFGRLHETAIGPR